MIVLASSDLSLLERQVLKLGLRLVRCAVCGRPFIQRRSDGLCCDQQCGAVYRVRKWRKHKESA